MKKVLFGFLALAVMATAFSGIAYAKEDEGLKLGVQAKISEEDRADLPTTAEINKDGKFILRRATVVAVGTNTITVQAWGFTMMADTTGAKVTPVANASGTPITIAVGDKVTLTGTLSNNSAKVETIRDLSQLGTAQSEIRARIQELLRMIEQLRAQLRLKGGN